MTGDQISVRIDQSTKIAAENIFQTLGLSATDAVRMFYKQVVLQRGLPFAAKIPNNETLESIYEIDSGKGKHTSLKDFKKQIENLKK